MQIQPIKVVSPAIFAQNFKHKTLWTALKCVRSRVAQPEVWAMIPLWNSPTPSLTRLFWLTICSFPQSLLARMTASVSLHWITVCSSSAVTFIYRKQFDHFKSEQTPTKKKEKKLRGFSQVMRESLLFGFFYLISFSVFRGFPLESQPCVTRSVWEGRAASSFAMPPLSRWGQSLTYRNEPICRFALGRLISEGDALRNRDEWDNLRELLVRTSAESFFIFHSF